MANIRALLTRSVRLCAAALLLALTTWTPSYVATDGEKITPLASDCTTNRGIFTLGDTVCAIASGAPLDLLPQRRFEWIAPNGNIFQLGPTLASEPDSNSITLPTSGPFAQAGTWTVKTVDVSNNGQATANFLVQDSNKAAADLAVTLFAPFQLSAETHATFTLLVTNNGPNDAEDVQIKIGATGNATLLSAEQTAGPPFTGGSVPQSSAGAGTCTIEVLPTSAVAKFALVYRVDSGAASGASVSSTAVISSSTLELHPADNVATATAAIAPQPCVPSCPPSIVTVKPLGQCGVVVDYGAATTTGDKCSALTCNPPSGAFFAVGTTMVVCAHNTGSPCSFTVTVDDPHTPALTCPSDLTVTESSPGMGLAVVRYKPSIGSDNCAAQTSACTPPSGSSFPLGATTVSCETANASGACSFTVTVESSDCSLISSTDIAGSNRRNECGAVVNYAVPRTSGNCGSVTCTPPSGSVFPAGETTVSCITSTGSGSTFTVTVRDTQVPVITRVSANLSSLWPLNRKMRDVTVDYDIEDNCSGEVACTLSVNTDEPPTQGDAARYWEIVDARHVRLRADRTGKANSRSYIVTITCTDADGNSSSEVVKVIVPLYQG